MILEVSETSLRQAALAPGIQGALRVHEPMGPVDLPTGPSQPPPHL